MELSTYLAKGRVAIDLPCKIYTGSHAFAGRLSDLSFDGACLTAPGAPEFMPTGLEVLEVEGLGPIDVIFRWRRQERIGVSFRREHETRPRVEAFLEGRRKKIGARA